MTADIQWASIETLPVATLYDILRLRIAVFGVEQNCAYQDLDGRDLEPTTRHAWVERDGRVVSYLRVLRGDVIGRVVTDPAYRGQGLSSALLRAALAVTGRPVTIGAQSYLVGWYGSFGFAPCGPEYVEDGIPHTPMTLVV